MPKAWKARHSLLPPLQAAAHEDSPPQQSNALGPEHNQEPGQTAAVPSQQGESPEVICRDTSAITPFLQDLIGSWLGSSWPRLCSCSSLLGVSSSHLCG